MRKLIIFILLSLFMITPFVAAAEEVKYKNVITDTTTIAEDFEVIGLNLEEYYISSKYSYDKWYVVGMSEAYTESQNIQTYFYLFNPTKESGNFFLQVKYFFIKYKFGENDTLNECKLSNISYDEEHNVYKVKGFKYDYSDNKEIYVDFVGYQANNGNTFEYGSTFKSINTHSKIDGFSVELSFDTMLVIENYKVVEENVIENKNFVNLFINSPWWSKDPTSMYIYFYNFDFPDHIEYDDVIYAKFEYDLVSYSGLDINEAYESKYGNLESKSELSRETIIDEYSQKDNKLQVDKYSVELTFPTFYLGDRVKDKQFGELNISNPNDFKYDCSILLGATYEVKKDFIYCENPMAYRPVYYTIGEEYENQKFDDIEILELHYSNDGIVYKCQVAGGNVDTEKPNENFGQGSATPPPNKDDKGWLAKIIQAIIDFIKEKIKTFYENNKLIFWIIIGVILSGLIILLFTFGKYILKVLYAVVYIIFFPFILIYKAIKKKKE